MDRPPDPPVLHPSESTGLLPGTWPWVPSQVRDAYFPFLAGFLNSMASEGDEARAEPPSLPSAGFPQGSRRHWVPCLLAACWREVLTPPAPRAQRTQALLDPFAQRPLSPTLLAPPRLSPSLHGAVLDPGGFLPRLGGRMEFTHRGRQSMGMRRTGAPSANFPTIQRKPSAEGNKRPPAKIARLEPERQTDRQRQADRARESWSLRHRETAKEGVWLHHRALPGALALSYLNQPDSGSAGPPAPSQLLQVGVLGCTGVRCPQGPASSQPSSEDPAQGNTLDRVTLHTLGLLAQVGSMGTKTLTIRLSDNMTLKFLVVTKIRDRGCGGWGWC